MLTREIRQLGPKRVRAALGLGKRRVGLAQRGLGGDAPVAQFRHRIGVRSECCLLGGEERRGFFELEIGVGNLRFLGAKFFLTGGEIGLITLGQRHEFDDAFAVKTDPTLPVGDVVFQVLHTLTSVGDAGFHLGQLDLFRGEAVFQLS